MIFKPETYHVGEFSTYHNAVWKDTALSGESKGLLIYLVSHAPTWKIVNDDLTKTGFGKKAKLTRLLNELRDAGYMYDATYRRSNGTVFNDRAVFPWVPDTETVERLVTDFAELNDLSLVSVTGGRVNRLPVQPTAGSTDCRKTNPLNKIHINKIKETKGSDSASTDPSPIFSEEVDKASSFSVSSSLPKSKQTVLDRWADQQDRWEYIAATDYANKALERGAYTEQQLSGKRGKALIADWADTIRLLIEKDGYTKQQFREWYVWFHADSWWLETGNLISLSALRRKKDGVIKFQQMLNSMNAEKKKSAKKIEVKEKDTHILTKEELKNKDELLRKQLDAFVNG